MKLLIIGDSHDNIANIKHVMGFAQKMKVGAVIHCGDWDSADAVEAVLSYEIPLYSVLGNADVDAKIEDILKFESKKFDPYFLKINVGGRKIGIIHKIKKDQDFEGLDIVFSGHYHSKEERMVNFLKFVRPGALVNGVNFAVYETVNGRVEFIENG